MGIIWYHAKFKISNFCKIRITLVRWSVSSETDLRLVGVSSETDRVKSVNSVKAYSVTGSYSWPGGNEIRNRNKKSANQSS